ncbi:lipoprotein 17-related variable surface protein [Mycoplasma iguanae]|uniref:Lipoprotein 17-related variable surface protein n=1 Tax=Mycoplasma iguanae TaxID=292461 RepID=A0ABY5RAK1_9MOLU|nr:lipoprotein 17-related variable surface protein [Mycoplasma iguanae]UVD81804.1 lipoprotein 17-related variable surface protein [Mycoplasma iguanae]
MKNFWKRISFWFFGLFTLITSFTLVGLATNGHFTTAKTVQVDNKNLLEATNIRNDTAAAKEITQFQSSPNINTIITESGPILYDKNKIYAVDWFGEKKWEVDVYQFLVKRGLRRNGNNTILNSNAHASRVQIYLNLDQAWNNWIYHEPTKRIYILTTVSDMNTRNKNNKRNYQYIFPINALTGELPADGDDSQIKRLDGSFSLSNSLAYAGGQYYQISTLGNGNIVIFYTRSAGVANGGTSGYIFNPFTNELRNVSILVNNVRAGAAAFPDLHGWELRILNIIPVSKTLNFVLLVRGGGTGNNYYGDNSGLGAIFVMPADENLKVINAARDRFQKNASRQALIKYWVPPNKNFETGNVANRQDYGYNSSFFVNPITRVLQFSIYNKIFFVKENPGGRNGGFTYTSVDLPVVNNDNNNNLRVYQNEGILYSGYFDLLGDYYFNMATWRNNQWIVQPKIYRLRSTDGNPSIIEFLDLRNSGIDDINKEIEHFKIFPTPNQVGKIMIKNTKTGIAAAIVTDPNNPNVGKLLGTLNGSSNFLVRPGFHISNSSNLLLPSELANSNFLPNGQNDIINKIEVTQIDDKSGTITVKASISYLPWFEDGTSSNYQFLEEENKFSNLKKIQDISGWTDRLSNNLTNLYIEFFDEAKAEAINLFKLNAVLNNILTPNKYKIINKNIDTGEVTLEYSIQYHNNTSILGPLQSFNAGQKTYKMMGKKDLKPEIHLIGGSNIIKDKHVDITRNINIDQYSNLQLFKTNGLLPSNIANNGSSFLTNFLDMDKLLGYQLTDLKFSMEPNDSTGSLTVEITIPASMNRVLNQGTTDSKIKSTYTGFSKTNEYSFNFNQFEKVETTLVNSILNVKDLKDENLKTKYTNFLPSEVNWQEIFYDLFELKGFEFDAFEIKFSADDFTGNLVLEIKLKPEYVRFNKNTPFEAAFNNLKILIGGFNKINEIQSVSNQVIFKDENDPAVAQLQTKLAYQITAQDALSLIEFTPNENISEITTKNIILFPNNKARSLTIVVDLSMDKENFNNKGPSEVRLQNSYIKTYTNFGSFQRDGLEIQLLSDQQLPAFVDRSAITADYIFSNLKTFIPILNGYKITSRDQIEINQIAFSRKLFVTYNFENQKDLSNFAIKKFSVVYNY